MSGCTQEWTEQLSQEFSAWPLDPDIWQNPLATSHNTEGVAKTCVLLPNSTSTLSPDYNSNWPYKVFWIVIIFSNWNKSNYYARLEDRDSSPRVFNIKRSLSNSGVFNVLSISRGPCQIPYHRAGDWDRRKYREEMGNKVFEGGTISLPLLTPRLIH